MPQQRRHDIDALRAIAFGFLILYHVGMFYVPWDWHIKSTHIAGWLETPMLLLNQWRMPLIFLISGIAVNFLLGEGITRQLSYGKFAVSRTRRLLIPLLFGMAVVVPPQAYYQALSNGATSPGYLEFLVRYFTFQPWPADAFDGAEIGITWNHLWYLPYLLFYTLLLVPVAMLLDGPCPSLRRYARNLRGAWLVIAPVLWLLPIGLLVFPRFPYISHDFITDGYAHALYGSFFFFGYLIGRDQGTWSALARIRRQTLTAACVSYVAFRLVTGWADAGSQWESALSTLVIYLNRCLWICAVLGWGHQLLNRPMSWLPYANRAVYPWYILHQTITVVAGYHLARLPLGPVLEPVLLVVLTVGGCAAGMWVVERWLPFLSLCLGMKPRKTATARRSFSRRVLSR